jgi:cyclin-dependent kinase 9
MSKLYGNIYWPGVENLPLYSPLELSQNNDFTVQDYMIDYKPYIQEPLAIKLINKLLALNPKKRIDVNEAVKSEFLRAESSLTGSLQSLLSNHSSMFDSNEISRIVPQQQNVQLQPRNMSKITFETIY